MSRMSSIENITIFCDASHDDDTRSTGIGMWMKSDTMDGRENLSGSYRGHVDSNEAELYAVKCSLEIAIAKHKHLDQSTVRYVVVTDSDTVIRWITKPNSTDKMSDYSREEVSNVFGLLNQTKFWKFNPIKSHKSGKPRNWVNNHVDKLAKREMRALRNSIQYPNMEKCNAEVS